MMKFNQCIAKACFLLLFFPVLLSSCKFESNRTPFSVDLDNLGNRTDTATLTTSISHSGKHSSFVNPDSPYGFSFRAKFSEISTKSLKKVRVSFYAYEKDSAGAASMVFEVRNKNNESIFWRSAKAYEMIVPQKWSIVTQEYDLSGEKFNPDDEFRVYPWCRGNSETYFDDYLIEFYK